jgi:hypothetical protein
MRITTHDKWIRPTMLAEDEDDDADDEEDEDDDLDDDEDFS